MAKRSAQPGIPLLALVSILLISALPPLAGASAQSPPMSIEAAAEPATVRSGERVRYTLRLENASTMPLQARLEDTLPPGFVYIPGSTRLWANHTFVGDWEPQIEGHTLIWPRLALPAGRANSVYGMHTFVQDRCTKDYIAYQLDRVRELMGPGAFVKQLFYRITVETKGPEPCWIDFVNACYDRDLLPVVRLAGNYGGPYWLKPPAAAPGDYGTIAQAMARVVAGLPRRGNRPLYVEIWNEPNLDIEWGGRADPVEYGEFLVDVAAAIRALGDARIVLLNGGLSPGGNIDRLAFIDGMAAVPGALEAFDVWASHPYPGNHPPEYNIHNDAAPSYPELTIDSYLLELQRLADHGRAGVAVLLTETGYALGQNNFGFQGFAPIDESNRADYIARAFRDHWARWPEVLGACPYELVDPHGQWGVWDWLYPDGRRHQQYDAVWALDKTPAPAAGELVLRFEARAAAQQAGSYTNDITVIGDAGMLTAQDVAPVVVLPPPATPTPVPTVPPTPTIPQAPSPSPTPIATLPTVSPPTPTASPAADCRERIQNGAFETDDAWRILETSYPARYSNTIVHGGKRAAMLGIAQEGENVYSYSSIEQTIALPQVPKLTLRFWYYPISSDILGDRQYALLLDEMGMYKVLMWVASDARTWRQASLDLSAHAGQRVTLRFGVYNDGEGGVTAMYLDDVSLQACDLVPQPPPSATPPARIWLPLAWRGNGVGPSPAASLTRRPVGLASVPLPIGEDSGAAVSHLALDDRRQCLIVAAGQRIAALDRQGERLLWARELPGEVGAVEVEAETGIVYALLPAQGALYAFDSDGRPRFRLEDLGRPVGLAIGGDRAYLADAVEKRLLALWLKDGTIDESRPLPAAPQALALDAPRGLLYAGLMGRGTILALDAATLAPLDEVSLTGLGFPQDLALDDVTQRLYVAHALSPKYGALTIIDTATMSIIENRYGDLAEPLYGSDALCLDADGKMLYLGLFGSVARLDAQHLAMHKLSLGERVAVHSLALSRDGALYIGSDGRLLRWQDGDTQR